MVAYPYGISLGSCRCSKSGLPIFLAEPMVLSLGRTSCWQSRRRSLASKRARKSSTKRSHAARPGRESEPSSECLFALPNNLLEFVQRALSLSTDISRAAIREGLGDRALQLIGRSHL